MSTRKIAARRAVVRTGLFLAVAGVLTFDAGLAQAAEAEKYFVDSSRNVCVGNEFFSPFCNWEGKVTGIGNTALGSGALISLTSGVGNVATGLEALNSDTTGNSNVASGTLALASNTEGHDNIASGFLALFSNTTGHDNIASGQAALASNIEGGFNVASGDQALTSNTGGAFNVATGAGALESNTEGFFNTASGIAALGSNTTGLFNLASGAEALAENTEGNDNTAEGHLALSHAKGSGNVGVGAAAGENVEGSGNVEIANRGTSGDENTIRIGETQTRAFMAGIVGVTGLTGCFVKATSDGQLFCGSEVAAGATGATGETGAAGATGPEGKAGQTGATGSTGPTGPTGASGSQHAYSTTGNGGGTPQTLTLTAPTGQNYVAIANAQGTVSGISRPLVCTLSFGPAAKQRIAIAANIESEEMSLQGAGALTSGTIKLSCSSGSGGKASVSNMSLIAYVVSGIN